MWVGVFAVLTLLAVTAVPGSAAPTGTKNFSFTVSPSSVAQGTSGQAFSVTVTNTSPKGSSSNISSLAITVPAEFTPTSASIDPANSTNGNASAVVAINSTSPTCQGGTSQTINVCSLDPVKRLQKVTIRIVANVTSAGLTCGANQSGIWIVQPNTGSQLNGDSFTENPVNAAPYTSITRQCPLDWVVAPSDTTVGADQTVTVGAYDGGGLDTDFDGPITIVVRSEPSAGSLTVTPDTLTAVDGAQSFTLSGDEAGSYTIYAQATGRGDAPDRSFTLFATDSSISGQKWRDHNGDGLTGADEQGISDWTIKAFDGTSEAGSATTNADGDYTISGLQAGTTYTVCEFPPAEDEGYEYRGWYQSVPASNTLCAGFEGAEPNGYTVTIPGPASSSVPGKDFFNVRTITIPSDPDVIVDCGDLPPGGVFTVGDGINDPIGTITVDPDTCKPGEYVFETWVSDGEQFAAFYPLVPSEETMPLIEEYEWVIDGDRTQHTLVYNDFSQDGPYRPMLFCQVDANGDFAAMPDASEGEDPHTSCLLNTTEVPTVDGVLRHDTVYTEVDGYRKI